MECNWRAGDASPGRPCRWRRSPIRAKGSLVARGSLRDGRGQVGKVTVQARPLNRRGQDSPRSAPRSGGPYSCVFWALFGSHPRVGPPTETLTSARMGHPAAVASSTRGLVTSRGPSCSLSPGPSTEQDTFIHSFTHLFKTILITCLLRARECTRHWVLL